MREKYIEERFRTWMVFGESDGKVDLADSEGDVFKGISIETAGRLIRARDAYVQSMFAIFMDDPEALYKFCGSRP